MRRRMRELTPGRSQVALLRGQMRRNSGVRTGGSLLERFLKRAFLLRHWLVPIEQREERRALVIRPATHRSPTSGRVRGLRATLGVAYTAPSDLETPCSPPPPPAAGRGSGGLVLPGETSAHASETLGFSG